MTPGRVRAAFSVGRKGNCIKSGVTHLQPARGQCAGRVICIVSVARVAFLGLYFSVHIGGFFWYVSLLMSVLCQLCLVDEAHHIAEWPPKGDFCLCEYFIYIF